MSAPKLPPLPEHRCLHTFVASASLGTVSVHGMHQDDVRAYGLACYQQAIEDAAKFCDENAVTIGHEGGDAIRRLAKDTP